jgi:hypothetical protein
MPRGDLTTVTLKPPISLTKLQPVVFGAIEAKWSSLGGKEGPLGHPVSDETPTFDGVGRFQNFNGGIISWHPETGAHVVWGAIGARWLQEGREAFGYPITDELPTPDGRGRFNHFRALQLQGKPEASIYWTPQTDAQPLYGDIRSKWAELGWERSFLGYPLAEEADFPEGGRVGAFEGGAIYWWPDTGPVELNDVVVHYTGLVCFGETDWDQSSDSDEPYVALGVISPTGTSATRSQVYEDVDSGESRPDLIELYRGKPAGHALSVLLMEHDEDDPDKYKAAMQSAVGAAFTGVTALLAVVPILGPVLAGVAAPLFAAVTPTVGAELNRLLDMGDDKIGEATLAVSARQMVLLAARTPNSNFKNIGFKLETPLMSGDGASYKAYFGLVPA